MVPTMTEPEAALCASEAPLFKTARNEAHDDIQILAWKAALNEERSSTPGRVLTVVHDEAPVELENRPMKFRRTNDKDVNAEEEKPAVKDLVVNELSALIGQLLDDTLRKSLENAQNWIPLVV